MIPDDATLAEAYRRTLTTHELNRRQRTAFPGAEEMARQARVPKDLRARIARELKQHPTLAWDEVVARLTKNTKDL